MDAIQNKLRELIVRHCGSLRSNAELLSGFIAEMNAPGNVSGQPARDALHLAHQIAGAGGSIGFSHVSVIASDIEHALQPIVAVNGTPSEASARKDRRPDTPVAVGDLCPHAGILQPLRR